MKFRECPHPVDGIISDISFEVLMTVIVQILLVCDTV
jgi:hypothetical protein